MLNEQHLFCLARNEFILIQIVTFTLDILMWNYKLYKILS
jgi:hypothetical protein